MSWGYTDGDRFADLVDLFARADLALPELVATAHDRLTAHVLERPTGTARDLLIAAGTAWADGDADARDLLIAEADALASRDRAWELARDVLGARAVAAVRGAHHEIETLLADAATEHISALIAAAAETEGAVSLLRRGERERADIAIAAEPAAVQLDELDKIRAHPLLWPGAAWLSPLGWSCQFWRRPDLAEAKAHLRDDIHGERAASFIGGVRAGAGLWWPRYSEAMAAVAEIDARKQREADAAKDAMRRQYGGHL